MALLDLKTDLKSLKYGQDTPGGGSSREPYIKVDINKVDSGFNQFRLTKFDDGLVRGGIVGATNASAVDTIRIGKFLTDFPKGPLFITKQIGLQLSNPQIEHRQNFRTDRTVTLRGTNLNTSGQNRLINKSNLLINRVTGTVAKGISSAATTLANLPSRIENEVGSTRIYNFGLNTLSQVTVNAAGGHILRHGFLPIRDESRDYINVITNNNFIDSNNRLTKYASKFGLGGFGPYLKSNTIDNELDSYVGGPESVYGLIRTRISRTDQYTNDKSKIEFFRIR